MKLITETVENVKIITEEKDGGKKNMYIEGIFLQGNIENKNGRVYNTDVLAREVNRYINEKVNRNCAWGELGHPNGPSINLDRVSHRIVELKQDGNNFIGKALIGSSGMGPVVRGLIEDGGSLGVSSRGMGSLKENKNGVMEVQSDFWLATAADIVADPSAPAAFVNGIMEGVEYIWAHGAWVQKTAEEIREEINKASRTRKLNEQKRVELFKRYLDSF